MNITLLGPQRQVSGAKAAVADLIPSGPIATVNAGWRDREPAVGELNAVLGGRMVNLQLYRRWQQLTEDDHDYAAAELRLNANLDALRTAYQLRLHHALSAERAVAQRIRQRDILAAASADAVQTIRALDQWHLSSGAELRSSFFAEVRLDDRDSVADHRRAIRRLVEPCAGMVITGGHVGLLLHLLQIFDLRSMIVSPVITWSAGAMALSERVFLFGEQTPQRPCEVEVYADGLGIFSHGVCLPYARRRLPLSDPDQIALVTARLAPRPGLILDTGSRLDLVDDEPLPPTAVVLGGTS
jgi:hypothetical protein